MRPGNIALRVVNQYRRRDVLTYLALRYYLDNDAAKADKWAREVSTDLILTRSTAAYFPSQHFKEMSEGKVEHRTLYIPGANEALAEAALLEECGRRDAFRNPSAVFSYHLSKADQRSGVFVNYFRGLQARHDAIEKASADFPNGVVRYLDIKKFYPNIALQLANSVWEQQCRLAELAPYWCAVGSKLLRDYGQSGDPKKPGLLTGPMFSHLVANLVLRGIDELFAARNDVRYIRYVDDIVLVGEKTAVATVTEEIRKRLSDLNLDLHADESAKTVDVPVSTWLRGKDDFRTDRKAISWLTLIRDLKQFLIRSPNEREALQEAFRAEGFRIPVRDYSVVAQEPGYLSWIFRMAKQKWFRRKARTVSIGTLVFLAQRLRQQYETEFQVMVKIAPATDGYDRKRILPKLRVRASRLVYLSDDQSLLNEGLAASEIPELVFHAEVMKGVATGRVDKVLGMGTNVAQAVAQPLRAAGKSATTSLKFFPTTKEQSMAVLLLNGISVERDADVNQSLRRSELAAFAIDGPSVESMRRGDAFVRELCCLHGISDSPRHVQMFDTVFDEDEMLAIDAVDQLNQSASP
jgi:hypothetical protein